MSKLFYINAEQRGNNIFLTYSHNGEVKYAKITDYQPTMYYEAHGQNTNFKELVSGVPLLPKKFKNVREANNAIREAHDVSGLTIYGNRNFQYAMLHEKFKDMENSYDTSLIRGFFLDIECPAEKGFPDPGKAAWAINCMCIYDTFTKKYRVWGLGDFAVNERVRRLLEDEKVNPDDVISFVMDDELELLQHMMGWWGENYPAYITGWNSSGFDLPYMCNRIQRMGLDMSDLSPWGQVMVREKEFQGKLEYKANICGIADLDYIELYKKNRFITRESYKLDFIASVELGRKKVDYSSVASDLRTLHKKDWELYATYNVVDVALIVQLEEKLGFLGITFAVAYAAGINYNDVSSPVATWENIFYRDLIDKNIILPNKKNHDKVNYEGAFVKAPQVGKHRWVCSFDLNSLYPHIIMGWNMSPETITSKVVPQVNVDMMVDGEPYDRPDGDLSVAPSGNTFLRSFQGIAGQQMERLYKERKAIKKQMLVHEQDGELVQSGDVNVINEMYSKYGMDVGNFDALVTEIAKQESLKGGGQQVRKILLNSFYGALANIYFCMFDIRIAESITLAGQLAIRWVGRKTNEYLNGVLKTDGVDYVVYTDTDSIYVNMEPVCAILGERHGFDHNAKEGEDVQKAVRALDQFCDDHMTPMIDRGYEDLAQYCNSYSQKMIMAREVISDNSVFCSKKMYAMSVWNSEGVQFEEAYIKVMGIGMVVKSSTPQFVRDASKNVVKLVLNKEESDVQDFIADFKKRFREEKPEAIAFPRGVNKLEESYCDVAGNFIQGKTVPIHSRAGIVYNKALRDYGLDDSYEFIGVADKMKFIHLELPNKLNQNVIGFTDVLPPELDLHKKVDYDIMFEKTFLKPVRDMTDLIGWTTEPVATLEDFFC